MADNLGALLVEERAPPVVPAGAVAIKAARAKLRAPLRRRTSIGALLGAGMLAAGSGLAFAAAMILGPPQLGDDAGAIRAGVKAPPVLMRPTVP